MSDFRSMLHAAVVPTSEAPISVAPSSATLACDDLPRSPRHRPEKPLQKRAG